MKYLKILILVFLASSCQAAEFGINDCSILNTDGVTYRLQQDILNSDMDECMYITAKNCVLDCGGHQIDGVGAQYSIGAYIYSSNGTDMNVSIRNCRINGWDYGVYVFSATNISVINTSISSSTQYGLFSYEGSGNTYRNVSVSGSGNIGFVLWNTSHNLIEGCNSSNNGVDGYLIDGVNSQGNTIRHSNAQNNLERGFYLYYCGGSTLYNVSSTNNSIGFFIYYANGNNITHSKSKGNSQSGIWLSSSGSDERNWVYDNLFNNTVNYITYGEPYPNNWNISAGSGANVLGGEVMGGNYWASPSGDGYSEEESDANGDGFCDAPYMLSEDDLDYLPLSTYAFSCVLEGNYAPCDEISVPEVIDSVDKWLSEERSLRDVLALIAAWMG